jgi:hypothetical protein
MSPTDRQETQGVMSRSDMEALFRIEDETYKERQMYAQPALPSWDSQQESACESWLAAQESRDATRLAQKLAWKMRIAQSATVQDGIRIAQWSARSRACGVTPYLAFTSYSAHVHAQTHWSMPLRYACILCRLEVLAAFVRGYPTIH